MAENRRMDAMAILDQDLDAVAERLSAIGRSLCGCRLLLTGGTGFFGKWLLLSFQRLSVLCDDTVSLTVLSRDPNRFLQAHPEFARQRGLSFLCGDVRSFSVPSGITYDFVIHGATAASAQLDQENPGEMFSVVADGTRHVLDVARECGTRRLLYVSSGAVYGPQPPSLTHLLETHEGTPTTAYGRGKKYSEQLCFEASSASLECVIARPFAFVGPYLPLDIHYAIGNFIRDALANRPIIVSGDGRPCRSYMYAADLAVWLWAFLLSGKNGAAYNVGSPEAISIADLAHLVSRLHGSSSEVHVKGAPDVSAPAPRYVPDTRLAETSLGLRRHYTLSDAVLRTMRVAAATQA